MILKISSIQTYLFRLLIFLLPTQVGLHLWPDFAFVFGIRVDYFSPTIYLTDLLVLLFVLWRIPKQFSLSKSLRGHWKKMLLLVFFSSANIVVSQNPQISFLKWLKVYETIILAVVISRLKLHWVKDVFIPFSLSLIVFGLIGFLQFLKQGSIGGILYFLGERTFALSTPGVSIYDFEGRQTLRMYSTFSHPNSFAGYTLVSFLVVFRSKLNTGRKNALRLMSQIVTLTSIVFTFSHASYFASVFLLTFSFFRNFRFIKAIFIFLISVSMLLPILADNIRGFVNLPQNTSQRLNLAVSAGELFGKNPLLGVGLNNYVYRLSETSIPKEDIWRLQPVHNIFLLVMVETGLMGFLAFCYLLYRLLSYSLAVRNYNFVAAILAILLTGLVDHYWLTLQQNQLLFAVVVGLAFNVRIAQRKVRLV